MFGVFYMAFFNKSRVHWIFFLKKNMPQYKKSEVKAVFEGGLYLELSK